MFYLFKQEIAGELFIKISSIATEAPHATAHFLAREVTRNLLY